MILWLHTRILRAYWWLRFWRARKTGREVELTPRIIAWAHATTGHLNTPQSQMAREIVKREQRRLR